VKRRKFFEEFKARVALKAITGQKTVQELAEGFGIYVNQIKL